MAQPFARPGASNSMLAEGYLVPRWANYKELHEVKAKV